jgi:hypothetical protein
MFRIAARITCLLVLPVLLIGCSDSTTNPGSDKPDPAKANEAAGKMKDMYGPPIKK